MKNNILTNNINLKKEKKILITHKDPTFLSDYNLFLLITYYVSIIKIWLYPKHSNIFCTEIFITLFCQTFFA